VNKNDLIQKLAEHTGIDKNTSAKAVDGVFDLIAGTLKSGEEVRGHARRWQGSQSADRRGNNHQAVEAAAFPPRQAAQGFPEPIGVDASHRRRIVLLGCAGSGRTKLGRRLSERTGVPFICLDAIWQPDWTDACAPPRRERGR
jgi:DNA-binding protein HU-beta